MRRHSPLLALSHHAVKTALERWDVFLAVDATTGNGYDTVFLARCAGRGGRVLGCDVQPAALEATRARLKAEGLADRVCLVLGGHEHLNRWLAVPPDDDSGGTSPPLAAAMFNLGYLPGSDKRVITRSSTTLTALEALLPRMAPGGVISLHMYTGHEGGAEEASAVLARAEALSATEWSVLRCEVANVERRRECLLLLEYR